MRLTVRWLALVGFLLAFAPRVGAGDDMIPEPIRLEHQELHASLEQAMRAGGRTGAAARELEAALGPHFEKEERYALPPLDLLPALSRGAVTADMKPMLQTTAAFERELPRMLREHAAIVKAARRLEAAARAEGKRQQEAFVAALLAHARMEEEVLYPAALLVGKYLALRLAH